MGRQQPTPQSTKSLLRTASAVLVLLAAHFGHVWPACAAPHPTPEASAATPEKDARAALRLLESSVRARAARVSSETCASAEAMLEANAKRVDATALRGVSRVARRLGREFATPARALNDERSRLRVTWGELVIARTFAANVKSGLSTDQLVALHRNGLGWGLLAAGLGLDLADAVSAVNAEARVATGTLPADGRVATIRSVGLPAGPEPGAI